MSKINKKEEIFLLLENSQLGHLLSNNLIHLGYQVIFIDLLSEALNLLTNHEQRSERNRFKLIIIGSTLTPTVTRVLLSRIRSNDKRTPILVITSAHSSEEKQKFLEIGANDYIGKPFTLNELLVCCQDLLKD